MALCGSCFREISGDICPFCGWEEDKTQRLDPDDTGANAVTLNQARANFKRFGRAEKPE